MKACCGNLTAATAAQPGTERHQHGVQKPCMVTNQLGIRWLICAKVTKRLLRDQPTLRGWLVCNHLPLTLCPSSMWYGVDGLWRVCMWCGMWCGVSVMLVW